jgi:hypothetical protein
MIRRADGSYSKRGLWDNIRDNKGSGKKPTKEMLEQERKIKSKEMKYGGTNNPGFEALPDYVQAKILANMGYGGMTYPYMQQGGEPDGAMALGQIDAAIDKLSKLRQFIKPDSDLEPWVSSKLTMMDDYADAVSDYMSYNPEAQGEQQEMRNGGYVVTRSNDRKGKTHKVTGPDGTVKYFGDSKLGQHPNDPERKKAFYARHKKNLDNNPYFRAFARATWKDGGSVFSGNAWYKMGGQPCYECGGMYEEGGEAEMSPEPDPGHKYGKRTKVAKFANVASMLAPLGGVSPLFRQGMDLPKIARYANTAISFGDASKGLNTLGHTAFPQTAQVWEKYRDGGDTFIPHYQVAGQYPPKTQVATVGPIRQDGSLFQLPNGEYRYDNYAQVERPEGIRYYMGSGKSMNESVAEDMAQFDARQRIAFSPADSISRIHPQIQKRFFKNRFQNGGPVVGQEMDVTPEQLEELRRQGYQFEMI